jgi:hypothetical protein
MAGSGGALRSAIGDVRLLQDLVNRYHLGQPFPIVKELLQNADDGGASWMRVGWSPGVPGASHMLLAGPGIFVQNDGPFTGRDLSGIQRIGASGKVSQSHAIGRFGYGLKKCLLPQRRILLRLLPPGRHRRAGDDQAVQPLAQRSPRRLG